MAKMSRNTLEVAGQAKGEKGKEKQVSCQVFSKSLKCGSVGEWKLIR